MDEEGQADTADHEPNNISLPRSGDWDQGHRKRCLRQRQRYHVASCFSRNQPVRKSITHGPKSK